MKYRNLFLTIVVSVFGMFVFYACGGNGTNGDGEAAVAVESQDNGGGVLAGDESALNVEAEDVSTTAQEMPQFVGGEEARMKFIAQNIKYPEEARKKGIEGTVYVEFKVEADGKVSDVKVVRGIGGGCDEEAVRVAKMFPNWIPGKQDGKNVSVMYKMPIKFTLATKATAQGDAKKTEPEHIYIVADKSPEFVGGEEARMSFLSKNIKYPEEAREKGIQGMVYVEFFVDKDGKVSDVKAIRGIGGGCDEEAVRVVSLFPDWIPGKQNGNNVGVMYRMPIRFTLAS